MTRHHAPLVGLLALTTTLAATAPAQSENSAPPLTKKNPRADASFLNRIHAAYRGGFNIKPRFTGVGGSVGTDYGPATGPGNRRYDDGYNLVDGAGNRQPPYQDTTYYWAFHDRPTQITSVGSDTFVTMHSSSSPAVNSTPKDDGAPLPGIELTYDGELARWGPVRVGMEAAFGYMGFCIRDNQPLGSTVRRVSDTFKLASGVNADFLTETDIAGIANPSVPTDNGAGAPLLGNAPASEYPRVTDFAAVTVTGGREFSGDIFSGRIGPYIEIPFCNRVSAIFSGGLSIVGVSSRFSYTEAIGGNPPISGSGNYGNVLVGGYVSGNLNFLLTSRLGLFGGVQYQDVGTYSHPLNGKTAELDLSQVIFVTAGVSLEF